MSSSPPPPKDEAQAQNQPTTTTETTTEPPSPSTLPIKTHHCRFCATLLIASTRSIDRLPTRRKNAADSARILPLRNYSFPSSSSSTAETDPDSTAEKQIPQEHYTILLSTNSRDRKPTLIRREDGFEKRFFLRCGRCRVTVGYFLDEVHFPVEGGLRGAAKSGAAVGDGQGEAEEDRAIYLLPGALMETEIMSDEEKMRSVDREWRDWF
ncbi:hypothetical protein BDW62DRAFT_191146, partial [Aspergillus aurantiobrunneus]